MADSANQQLLVLKVMRLARPKLSVGSSFASDPADPSGLSQLVDAGYSLRSGEEGTDSVIGQYALAPQIFENIHLGETFTFYINVANEGDQKVSDVYVKCELQTNSQRIALPCSITDGTLAPTEVSGQVISHEVKELGQHILICSVSYKTSSDEKMYFRKFFKFPVAKPIDVKTKFYDAEDCSHADVYLEAQIENTATVAMFLEKVELEPTQHYKVTPAWASFNDDSSPCGKLLRPGDIRQFLFCLSPVDISRTNLFKDMTTIGKLDMSWRTSMGERGRLQTSSLQRIAPGHGDIRLVVDELPAIVKKQVPFEMQCSVHNSSERALDLVLSLSSTSSIVFCSLSGLSLGQLPPNASVPFKVEVLPVTTGFQRISGIRFYDSNMKRTYDNDDVAQIFIQ